jgi:hypothetical protein
MQQLGSYGPALVVNLSDNEKQIIALARFRIERQLARPDFLVDRKPKNIQPG